MSTAIHKFVLPAPVRGVCTVEMQHNAVPLSVGVQNKRLVVWALVAKHNAPADREFYALNTGEEAPAGLYVLAIERQWVTRFLGTVDVDGIVWHVWDTGYSTPKDAA